MVEVTAPAVKESRPNPVKAFSETAIHAAHAASHAATSAFRARHPPQRSNTVGPAVTTSMAVTPAQLLPVATQPVPENQGAFVTSLPSGQVTLMRQIRPLLGVTTVSNVPTWLLNACQALNFLTAEHPRAMTTLSAVLITAGTLPAIPAISGGTVLASGVAQAVGAIAVGVGNLLKAQQEGQLQMSGQTQAPPGHHPPMRAATFQ